MKNYIKMIPLAFYPYAYMLYLVVMVLFGTNVESEQAQEIFTVVMWGTVIIYNLYVIVSAILNTVNAARGKYSLKTAAMINLLVKCVHIPAYIIHFVMGMCGLLMSVWGIGFVMFAIVIDLLTIILSGINSIGCSIRMRKEGILSLKATILFGIANFIYCLDLITAIYYLVKAIKNRKKETE